tara:strand:- start:1267 stop:3027 length:1761 start_codon:yes stop_codon:yes gene_type:complete
LFLSRLFVVFIIISFSLSNDISLSFISKFGDGGKVNEQSQNTTISDFQYMENLLDVNYFYNDNFQLFSQLEYTSPPLIGFYNNTLNQILKKYYFEYFKDKYYIKIGDLDYLSGYGMGINTYQDQTLDFDNMLRGIEANYNLNDDILIRGMMGSGSYHFRSVSSLDSADFYYDKETKHFEIQNFSSIGNDFINLSNFTYSFLYDESIHYKDQIINTGKSYIGSFPNLIVKNDLNERFFDIISLNTEETSIIDITHSLSMDILFNGVDVYIEKTWVDYQKILDNSSLFGNRFYVSFYKNIFGYDVTYDQLHYNAPYQISNLINPPICMFESNSPLTSRTTTTIDFNNAIANQIEIRRTFGDVEILFNSSLFYKKIPHDDEGHLTKQNMNYFDILNFNIENEDSYNDLKNYHPIRKNYAEMSKWFFDYKLFIKMGIATYKNLSSETAIEESYTLPVHYSYKIANGSTITGYLEYQNRIKERNLFQGSPNYYSQSYDTYYNSLSYSFKYNYVISLFQEIEKYSYDDLDKIEKGLKSWYGVQFSLRFLDNNSIEAFYGSQRGGLICANGVCGVYPGFKDGFKVTLRLNYDI